MENSQTNVRNALKYGDLYTRLSALVMGAGLMAHKQLVKGLLVLACEIAFIIYMIKKGLHSLSMMPSLGTQEQGKVWNEAKQIFEYTAGDNSQQILLAGVVTCFVIAAIILLWILQMRHSYHLQKELEAGHHVPDFKEDVRSLFDKITEKIASGEIISVWALGFGGAAEAMLKMSMGNHIGTKLDTDADLFAPAIGSFIVEYAAAEGEGKIGETTDKSYDVITSAELRAGHFYEGFGYYGKFMDGRPLIIMFKNALCTSGFTTDAKNKTNSVFKGTFVCQSDIEYGTTKLPYAIFIRKADGWTAVTPEELDA